MENNINRPSSFEEYNKWVLSNEYKEFLKKIYPNNSEEDLLKGVMLVATNGDLIPYYDYLELYVSK